MNISKIIQHGEVLLVPVDKNPQGEATKYKQYIVAHSETGHHHILKSDTDFEVIMDKLEVYLILKRGASLVHEKTFDVHPTKTVTPGKYVVINKTEYTPAEQVTRRVTD